MFVRALVSATVVAAVSGSASATIFSFASDIEDDAFTFAGFGNSIVEAPGDEKFDLLYDDENGPLPVVNAGKVAFDVDATISYLGSTALGGTTFLHNYSLNGSFDFLLDGSPLLTIDITGGALTAIGSMSTWSSTSVIQAADTADSAVVYTWFGADDPAYGLFNGQSINPDDAAFTLTFLQSSGGLGVPLGTDFLPSDEWMSEGSFSGSAQFVPAPMSLAGLGLGVLGLARRRRD